MFVTVDNTNAFFSGKNRDTRKTKNSLFKFILDFESVHAMLYELLTEWFFILNNLSWKNLIKWH